ncbi:LysR family transcriptional regulator [Pseudoalteromonas sp. SSDWG2]|uniref:LysR family transcriptional regulator n=1 Tax=Pseudoalteromonas sp. SSDWG2 TaxID=3139391 RepID=UPI003BABDF02
MEDWDAYRLILAIHRGKTLRNAAKLMTVNHSTIARRLAQLNHSYGYPVIESTPVGYTLTKAGVELLQTAQQLETLIVAQQSAQRAQLIDHSGNITVSIPPAIAQYLLLDEFSAFTVRYPNISLSLQCSYNIVDIDNYEADIVIRVANKPSEHLVGHCAGAVYVNYYANQHYFENTSPDNYTWIVRSADVKEQTWIKHSPYPCAPAGIVIDDLHVRHDAANRGLGLLYGACYIAGQMDNLIEVGNQEAHEFAPIWVLTHPTLIEVPRIKLLMTELYTAITRHRDTLMGKTALKRT